jgi:hypothetical protein
VRLQPEAAGQKFALPPSCVVALFCYPGEAGRDCIGLNRQAPLDNGINSIKDFA